MGWSRFPVEPGDDRPAHREVGDDGRLVESGLSSYVVGLGAMCGLRSEPSDDGSVSVWVSEFAVLANGRRVILHEDRGFTVGPVVGPGVGGASRRLSARELTDTALDVVRPDPEDGEEHAWSWLAELAHARGLAVTEGELRGIPYEVLLTEALTRWFDVS